MRLLAAATLALGLAACGGGDGGEELAAGNSELSQAQIDAALGPADQSMVQDALPADTVQNNTMPNAVDPAAKQPAPAQDEEER